MSLSATELASIRADLESLMDQTAIIYRENNSTVGGYEIPGTVAAGTADCMLAKAKRQVIQDIVGSREAEGNYYMLTVPSSTDIRPHDKVTINSDSYEIRALWDDHSFRAARRALVSKLD
jgi:hypothetical protein